MLDALFGTRDEGDPVKAPALSAAASPIPMQTTRAVPAPTPADPPVPASGEFDALVYSARRMVEQAVADATAPLHTRIAELEAQCAQHEAGQRKLRERLAGIARLAEEG